MSLLLFTIEKVLEVLEVTVFLVRQMGSPVLSANRVMGLRTRFLNGLEEDQCDIREY